MRRRACLLTLLALGCERSRRAPEPAPSEPTITRPPYRALLARVAALREEHAAAYGEASTDAGRQDVMRHARRELQSALADVLLPAWLGTRWSFHGTADEPLSPRGIACGYFVSTLLQHAGLELESRRRFGQSTALRIARSLVPPGRAHHRIFSVPAPTLEKQVRSLGDGVHLLGLNVHVGFVVVDRGEVRVVHASYLGSRTVVSEPITACEAVERSRDAGYHVTSLFADDTLTHAWLSRRTIPLVA